MRGLGGLAETIVDQSSPSFDPAPCPRRGTVLADPFGRLRLDLRPAAGLAKSSFAILVASRGEGPRKETSFSSPLLQRMSAAGHVVFLDIHGSYMYVLRMGRAPRAIHVLNDAEAALRALIAAALKSKQYKDVSVIASLADKLARLRQEVDSSEQTEEEDAPALADSLAPQTIVSRAQAPKSGTAARRLLKPKRVTVPDDYPRFERSDDRLVKVGWSKRDGRSYAHKAPKPGVFLFVRKVRESVGPGKVFSMDKLLPIRDEKGQEVPSYQAYVALAWLRSCGFIERRTKDGYGYAAGALEDAQVERLWASTREQA